ncbi:threonylcarbamoyl-AMP synthase [Myxococcota bacterium]|nr:threonylcarbamoyl-AMP synthase [Myxococcota bacterium]
MRIISVAELQQSPHLYDEIADALRKNGTVCFPTHSTYRLATPFLSEEAVINVLQIKRRTNKAPSLVMIPNAQKLKLITRQVSPEARSLIERFWPGPLTLLFEMGDHIPKKIVKNLQNNGVIGVRVPEHPLSRRIVEAFDAPLLISSANLARKRGETSEAQVRKNFGQWIDILISAGDLSGEGSSTVVDVTRTPPRITRQGILDEQQILSAWQPNLDSTRAVA